MSRESTDITRPVVFIIGPTDVPVQVRTSAASIVRFASSTEFEQWRRGSVALVDAAVNAALAELKILLTDCSSRTQEILRQLQERETIPSVKELASLCSSRRSFYRAWSEDIGESPAAFLERVRLVHLRTSAENRAAQRGTAEAHSGTPAADPGVG